MAERPFRFIQAGDFHLERPLYGMTDVPEQLHDLCIDAPYRAAQRVFDAVLIAQRRLSRALRRHCEHRTLRTTRRAVPARAFERLRAAEINVYWLGGEIDPPDACRANLRCPTTCATLLAHQARQTLRSSRRGITFAQMIGQNATPRRRALRGADFYTARTTRCSRSRPLSAMPNARRCISALAMGLGW